MSNQKNRQRFFRSASIALALILLLTTPALAYFNPGNGQAAALVLGQPDFTTAALALPQNGFNYSCGVAVDPTSQKVFVADCKYNRVLRFASVYSLSNDNPPEAVLGQPNFTTNSAPPYPPPPTTQASMHGPHSIFVDSTGRLWVADSVNNRVLRFDHAATLTSGANATVVLGQPNFTSHAQAVTSKGMNYPYGLFVDTGGRLWVVDRGNNRVLRFSAAASKGNGAAADGVLGQPNFTSASPATTPTGMNQPTGVVGDSAGRLWVTDLNNNRTLRFDNAAAKTYGAAANGVLGQADLYSNSFPTCTSVTPPTPTQSSMCQPTGITVDNASGRLFVADSYNSRILVFDSAAGLANGGNATSVLGQPDFVTGTSGITASNLSNPVGVFYDPNAKVLWVADTSNNRVLVFGSFYPTIASSAAPDGWVLESSPTSGVGGGMGTGKIMRVGNDSADRLYRSFVSFDTSSLPDTAVIQSVTLKILKAGKTGTDPLTLSGDFGPLTADIQDGYFGTSSTLQKTDYQASASAYAVANFTAIGGGWYSLVLPPSDYGYINLTGLTQFRLRFALDSGDKNHKADYDSFFAGAAPSADRPILTIGYTLP
ncbi:MAG: hypothetical protein WCE68_17360 [Anaerolineales bacterium]